MRNSEFLKSSPIAHRGLHSEEKGIIENSLGAFKEAIDNKLIIELDVHLLKDDTIVVYHDDNINRLTNIDKPIKNFTYEELKKINLNGSNESIPRLIDVLDLVNGKVPLLIEIKNDNPVGALEPKLANILDSYKGDYAIQSFNPLSINWFKKNRPNVIRGQLSSNFKNDKMSILKKLILSKMLLNCITKPDFISYDVNSIDLKSVKKIRSKKMILGWTIRSKEEYERLIKHYDNLICEGFKIV